MPRRGQKYLNAGLRYGRTENTYRIAGLVRAATPGSPITGTATFTSSSSGSPPACLGAAGTTTLTVSGAEASGGGLNMALINGPDGNSPKIDLPAKGAASTAFADPNANDQ